MKYLLSSFIGLLLGSIPTAYLLLKKKGIDIRKAGSGNVGALNSFEVSKSKITGVVVFLGDFLKGFLSVEFAKFIFPGEFIYPALALFFAVLAHCFNPWLKFKGGRGLATTAGGSLLFFPFLLIVWIALWLLSFSIKRDLLFANITATFFSLLVVFVSSDYLPEYTNPHTSPELIIFAASAILSIVIIKHIEPLIDLFKKEPKK